MDQIVITIEALETLQQKRARMFADMENNVSIPYRVHVIR